MFGILARCGGTIFVERTRSAAVGSVSSQIGDALRAGIPVVLFPEGTSTDGSAVLSFFPALFEAAVQADAHVYASAIAYEMADGREVDLCYYADITFGPHLLTTLARRDLRARIAVSESPNRYANRKLAARETHTLVVGHRAALGHESMAEASDTRGAMTEL